LIYLLVTRTWTQPNVSGSAPSPRDKLTTATIGRKIYVFGGFGPKSTTQVNYYCTITIRYLTSINKQCMFTSIEVKLKSLLVEVSRFY